MYPSIDSSTFVDHKSRNVFNCLKGGKVTRFRTFWTITMILMLLDSYNFSWTNSNCRLCTTIKTKMVDMNMPLIHVFVLTDVTTVGIRPNRKTRTRTVVHGYFDNGYHPRYLTFCSDKFTFGSVSWRNFHLLCVIYVSGQPIKADEYMQAHIRRRTAIQQIFWVEETGAWFDYDMELARNRNEFYPSNIMPMWANCYADGNGDSDIEGKVLNYLKVSMGKEYKAECPVSKNRSEYSSSQKWLRWLSRQILLQAANTLCVPWVIRAP